MKARLQCLLLLLLCSAGAAASPDSVKKLEMFIDTDPGIGLGVQYTVAVPRDTINASLSITVPATTKPGLHFLYIRSYADSLFGAGRWGLAQRRAFYVPDKVAAAEYFFDNDPGVGNGTPLTAPAAADTISLTASVSTASLAAGPHTLYVRTKDNSGRWGFAQRRKFFIKEYITAAEYFYDTDPGVGNGTPVAVSMPSDTITQGLSIVTPAGFGEGVHTIYYRTKSDGKWSLTASQRFYVLPRIVAAEYFFDNDPGVGGGTALSVGTPSDTVNGNYGIATTGLPGGAHRLYVRTKSASGRWSLSSERRFYIRPKIVAAEYFWDTDPGPGSGLPLSVAPQTDTVTQTYSIKAPCLAPGTHYVYIRTKDEFGNWSLTEEDTATFANPTVVATATYPGPGPYGTPVKVLGSGGIGPYTYAYGAGTPTADSLFLPPNAASATFTAYDTCGYSGSTTITTPAAPVIIAGGTTGTGTVTLDGYRFWTYVLDVNGNIIGAVRDNRQMLGTVTMSFAKNSTGTIRRFPTNNKPYLDRNFYMTSTTPPVSGVGLELFAVDTEYNALAAADPLLTSKSALKVTKYNGINEDLTLANNGASLYTTITPDSVTSFTGQTAAGAGYSLAFSVMSFSEFYESRVTIVTLPIQRIDLQAVKQGSAVRLNWHTDGEKDTRLHRLMRGSSAGGDPEQIAMLQPGGGTSNDYVFTDEHPLTGANYYRVTVEGRNGEANYSQTVVVRMSDTRLLSIAPNPAHDLLRVSGLEAGDGVSLRDMAGHAVWQSTSEHTEMSIGTASFAAGIYMLVVDAADGPRVVQRVEIVH